MGIILFLVIGLVVGWVASILVEGKSNGSIGNIVVGVIGAIFGGFIYQLVGISTYGQWGDILMSVFGAIVFLMVLNFFSSRRSIKRA